jgi:hypothetical protein
MRKFFNHHYLFVKEPLQDSPADLPVLVHFGGFEIYSGIDTEITSVEQDSGLFAFVVLGFFISIEKVGKSISDLLAEAPVELNHFLDYSDTFVGVYLIFRHNRTTGEVDVINDASATYKCFYQFDESEKMKALSSDPLFLNKYCKAEKDSSEDALSYYASPAFKAFEHRVGALTSFATVYQLLPNHMLNFTQSKVSRVFPREMLKVISMEDASNQLKKYFDNIIDQLFELYDVKVAVTAGWDSRMVLASSLNQAENVSYYTFLTPQIGEKHVDITIARKICETLGLNYKAYDTRIDLDQEEMQEMRECFELVPEKQARFILKGTALFNSKDVVVLEGTVSEIAKNYYEDVLVNNGETLCRAAHYPVHKYSLPYFDQKYADLKDLEKRFGYDVRDIGHWEQDISNFAAQNSFMKQAYSRVLAPFNSRKLIDTVLSVDRSARDKLSHEFYNYFLRKYYPELLEHQVNPRLKVRIIQWMKKMGVYSIYRNLIN